jgi:16S rRNA (guanine527-N7)-methyltransferase
LEPGILHTYFPALTASQLEQYELLGPLYKDWNGKINVISRQDIDNLYERHVLHSLAIARIISFRPGTKILDAGTGGGFPGIPLAIMFPETHFHLVDSTAKKLLVVRNVAEAAGLVNISTEHCRLEEHHGKYDFVVSRAVSTLEEMVRLTWKNVSPGGSNELSNGLLCLKGGDLAGETDSIQKSSKTYDIGSFFPGEFFSTKKVIHIY